MTDIGVLTEPSTEGLLTDIQLAELVRIKLALMKIREAIERVNALALDTGLRLRPVPDYPLGQMGNDISQLVFSHELAEKRIREAAFAAAERMAA